MTSLYSLLEGEQRGVLQRGRHREWEPLSHGSPVLNLGKSPVSQTKVPTS